ncbi:MAG: DUF5696 domain-containing protein [Clostridia bacterium]|nr:DUF5696 domain-containing protein [Clostridia bacterium]
MNAKALAYALLLGILLALLCAGSACAYDLRPEDEGFQVAAETENRALLFNEKTLQVRLVDIPSGKTWDNCVMNGQQGNKTVKNTQKSTLLATFISNAQNATTNTFDTYSKSVQTETYEWELTQNGVEIRFNIGDDTLIVDDIPKGMRADKYQALLDGAGWSNNDKKKYQENYRAVKISGLDYEYMIRVKDDSLSPLLIKQLHELIFSSGIYTEADMDEDNLAVNYERTYLPELQVTLRYSLDGDDLLVTIPCNEVTFTEENEITVIELLPYFLSADTNEEGFILVPDGCGALINLNNQKAAVTAYSMPVYGRDALINASTYVSPRQDVQLPVFGLKRTDSAMLAIIEKGAELASVYANISGRSDEFNRVDVSFTLRDIESVSLAGNESVTSPRYSSDVYQGDIVMRYQWLTDENDGYLEMAKAYRQYLIGAGKLAPKEKDAAAPFYMEILGAVKKQAFFLGVPYSSSVQATTIAQAKTIYEAARNAGIRNISLIYSGLFSGGIKNASLTRLSLDGGIGSAKDLTALAQSLRQNGDTLYPGVYWGRVYSNRGFNSLTQASRKHDGEPARAYVFGESVLKHSRTSHPGYYISPYYLPDYTEKALNNLKKLNLNGLNLYDLGNTPVGDFKRKQNLSRISAIPVYENALNAVSSTYSLILDAPLLYALPYADGATNLPSGDNGFAITDASIPFLQWVLDGSMAYSSSSWNLESYLGLDSRLLWALESGSCPRFTFCWQDPSLFAHTEDMDYMAYFSTQYEGALSEAARLYQAYDAFYQKVKNAQIMKHEILSSSLRKVTYDNGIILYLNYGKTEAQADGIAVSAQGYAVREEAAK